MKKISLITVYNNASELADMTESAKNQKNVDVEFISLDNTNGDFSSAAKALNYGAMQANGDVLVFLHQDIVFCSDYVLEYVYNFLSVHEECLCGAAGVENDFKNRRLTLSSMYQGDMDNRYDTIDSPREVFSLDECFMACKKSLFSKIKYDEKLCDGWHLYGVDLCLQAKVKGIKSFVLPLDILHKSIGNVDDSFAVALNKLAVKYRKNFSFICTTCSFIYTNPIKRALLNLIRKLKHM